MAQIIEGFNTLQIHTGRRFRTKFLGDIRLDSVLTETHASAITLTKNPVEFGADITDHAIVEPRTLTIRAIVADATPATGVTAQLVGLGTGLLGGSKSRSNVAFTALQELHDRREPFDVQTTLSLYRDMVIIGLTTVRDKTTRNSLEVVVDLQEVRIVETVLRLVEVKDLKPDVAEIASPQIKRGKVQPEEASEPQARSLLSKLIGD